MTIGRSCIVCGSRTSGATRCPDHELAGQRGRLPRSCIVCGVPAAGEHCREHAPRDVRQPYRRGYYTSEARAAREAELKAAGGRCRGCGRFATLSVDHVTTLRDGGDPSDPANLQALCPECHNAKTTLDRRLRKLRKARR